MRQLAAGSVKVVLAEVASHRLRALLSKLVAPVAAASRQRSMCDRLRPVYRLQG